MNQEQLDKLFNDLREDLFIWHIAVIETVKDENGQIKSIKRIDPLEPYDLKNCIEIKTK